MGIWTRLKLSAIALILEMQRSAVRPTPSVGPCKKSPTTPVRRALLFQFSHRGRVSEICNLEPLRSRYFTTIPRRPPYSASAKWAWHCCKCLGAQSGRKTASAGAVEKIMRNAATTPSAGLAVLAYSGSRGAGVRLTQSADALIDAAAEDTCKRKELLTNDVPPGAGG